LARVSGVQAGLTQKHPEQQVGRYAIFEQIAAGGMARVHLARLTGQEGFSRVVAVKRMHRHLLENQEFKRMFLEEARLAARVRHPNVVPILDVLATSEELLIVMEYVHGVSVQSLMQASVKIKKNMPRPIVYSMILQMLHGLEAAHEAKDERGVPLGLVHRDVSPQNVLVGVDGIARVVDFGVARAMSAKQDTDPGVLKGKHSYMAPELVHGAPATRQADVFSAATLFWELIAGRKLFAGATEVERLNAVAKGNYPSPKQYARDLPADVERIILRGISVKPSERYATALEMAIELESLHVAATPRVVGDWVATLAAEELAARMELIHQVETSGVSSVRQSVPAPAPSPTVAAPAPVAPAPSAAKSESRGALGRIPTPVWIGAGVLVVLSLIGVVSALRSADSTPQPPPSSAPVAKPEPPKEPAPEAAAPPVLEAPVPEPVAIPDASAAAAPSELPVPELSPSAHGGERRFRSPARPKEFLPNEL
jgi:serine/threonine protein kinase